MIAALIRASVRGRFFVLIAAAGLLLAGLWAVRTTAVDALPDLSDVQVVIRTSYPGAAASEVSRLVAEPIEEAIAATPGLVELRSVSRVGEVTTTARFSVELIGSPLRNAARHSSNPRCCRRLTRASSTPVSMRCREKS